MILELDVGNSRIKWRLIDPGASVAPELRYARDGDELISLLSSLTAAPGLVRLCSVRGEAAAEQIVNWIAQSWSISVQIARVQQSCGGVRHQYADQTRLGVDRWLAMLAAYNQAAGSCVIVDSGTALTIDVVDGTGLHQGGYIVPGLQLSRDSLERNTRIRLSPEQPPGSLELGNSTDSAVCNGTLAALVSLINGVVAPVIAADSASQVYFAGGDAALLASHSIAEHAKIAPALVLDGLAIACADT